MRLHRLDLNRLMALDALLTERSVSRAADRVHLSQPAMSAALAALREHFGDGLLVPAGRALQITPFGASLVAPVREVLLQAQAVAQRRPGTDVARIERSIAIAASEFTTSVLLAPALQPAPQEAPGLRIDVRAVSDHFPEQLERGEVDVVVAPEEAMAAGHPSEPLFAIDFVSLVWEGHHHAAAGLTRDDYLAARHVSVRWASGRLMLHDARFLASAGLQITADITLPTFALLPPFLVQTQRVATLPRPLAQQLSAQWPLQVMDLPFDMPPLEGRIQWARHQADDPALGWLRDRLHSTARTSSMADRLSGA